MCGVDQASASLGGIASSLGAGGTSWPGDGCNSWRHIIGGKLNCFSCSTAARARHSAWQKVSILNGHHQFWAWVSMFFVGFADVYVRLCAMGIWHDWRIF